MIESSVFSNHEWAALSWSPSRRRSVFVIADCGFRIAGWDAVRWPCLVGIGRCNISLLPSSAPISFARRKVAGTRGRFWWAGLSSFSCDDCSKPKYWVYVYQNLNSHANKISYSFHPCQHRPSGLRAGNELPRQCTAHRRSYTRRGL